MNFIAWMIVACEVGFWIVILLGLVSRYLFNRNKLGLFFFALVPVLDLLLILATAIDIGRGGKPTIAHAIAPLYLGVSLVYGKSMIAWADERFRYYIKREGEKPIKRYGMDYAWHSLKGSLKHILAYVIGGALLLGMIAYVGKAAETEVFWETLKVWGIIVLIDNGISLTYFIWPRTAK